MKRFMYIILIIALVILSACSSPKMPAESPEIEIQEENLIKAHDLIPFIENTTFVYEGYGNEYASQELFFEYIEGSTAQIKVMNPGTNSVRILQRSTDQIKEIYFEGEFYHIEDMRNVKAIKDVIIIKDPIEVGNSWMVENSYIREITGVGVDIETPYGIISAVEVTTTLDNGTKLINYYKEGIGLVASIYSSDEIEVKTLLKDIIYGPMQRNIRIFYPIDSEQMRTVFTNYTLDFRTNDRLEDIFEGIFKEPVKEGLLGLISPDTSINSIKFDRNTWRVEIDFSKELLPGWNAGSTYELELIKSIVNTLGDFFDTDSVYITIEGKPFESGHMALREGEEFTVDFQGIDEY